MLKFLNNKFPFSKKNLISSLLIVVVIIFALIIKFSQKDFETSKRQRRDYMTRLNAIQAMLESKKESKKKVTPSENKGKDLAGLAEYESFYQEGTELYKKFKLIEAIQSFQKALKAKDTKEARTAISQIYNLLGMRETEKNNYDGAIEFFKKSFNILQNNQSLLEIANAYILKQDFDNALSTLEKSLSLYPENPKTYYHIGQIYYQKGNIEKALDLWKQALKLDPKDSQTEISLNKAKIKLGIDDALLKRGVVNFQVDSQGENNEITKDIVLTLFQQAYGKIEKDLNIYPSQKLKILLDFNVALSNESQNPNKNITIDNEKIKIPASGLKYVTETMQKVIIYSYTKFTVTDYMKGRCPGWFLEGISIYESDKIDINLIRLIRDMVRTGQFIKIENLSPSFNNLDRKDLSLNYALSFTIVDYIINKYGKTSIKELISKVKSGASFEDGLNSVLKISQIDLQKGWEKYLKEEYGI